MVVELQITARAGNSKGETKRIRREGRVPCILYALGKEERASFSKEEFQTLMRHIVPGALPTMLFSLKDQHGKAHKAIVKDVQYDVGNYDLLHLDFQLLDESRKVDVKVPVECKRQADCVGVKAGGFLRQAMRHVTVRCLPKDMPTSFELDVKDLDLGKVLRVRDIAAGSGVRLLAKPEEVVVAVIKAVA